MRAGALGLQSGAVWPAAPRDRPPPSWTPQGHGNKFRLKAPPEPERQATWSFGKAMVRLSAWTQLHFKGLPALVGMVVRVESLTASGEAMYKRSLGIEHFFRFAKRRMGLLIAQTPDLAASMNWVWVVTFAYAQLLLARTLVTAQSRPWDPKSRRTSPSLTPGQVRQAWLTFAHGLGTPAQPPRPSGKSSGRTLHPAPRQRFPVISKKQKRPSAASV